MDINAKDAWGNTNGINKAEIKSSKKKGGVTSEESDGCGSESEHV